MLAFGPFLQPAATQAQDTTRQVTVLEIDGPIGPPLADYLLAEMRDAAADGASLIVLEMDTPGGLDASMRRIIKAILASPVPVASYVSPSGARAASAGTYILYASHIAAMAPGTNLGAATPVQMGGGMPLPGGEEPAQTEPDTAAEPEGETELAANEGDDSAEGDAPTEESEKTSAEDSPALSNQDSMRAKAVNDASAYIKGLAELRGRNKEWAIKAVREAASLDAPDAADQNVIDFVATNLNDLLAQSDGREVDVNGEQRVVKTEGAVVTRAAPNWVTNFLMAITNPNVAFLLMTIGFYGLFFELSNPGAIFPGAFGAISLIIGLYALSVLPVSMAGAGLILLGLVLMAAEVFAPSFGALGIGGLAAFGLGATMLIDTEAPGFTLSWSVIIGTTVFTGAFMLGILTFALNAQSREVTTGEPHLLAQQGVVESWSGTSGWIIVLGEHWKATCATPLSPGQRVRILKQDGLTLHVEAI